MKLSALLREVEYEGRYTSDVEIDRVTDDSRCVRPNTVFVCVKHRSFDGHTAAKRAVEDGAAAVVAEHPTGAENELLVKDSKSVYAALCAALNGHPERQLRMIGITGTNGKTTTACLVRDILEPYSMRCGLLGTVQNILGDEEEEPALTTPKPPELYEMLGRMVTQGCVSCVMEASSQALRQGRLSGIDFDLAVFTNITQDHLDYHKTFENYLDAKKMLFRSAKKSVVNLDDPHAKDILDACGGLRVTYSAVMDCADYTAKNILLRNDYVTFELVSNQQTVPLRFAAPGIFSVYNAMAAAVCALEMGVPPENVRSALAMAQGVCGRLERVDCSSPADVIIDYAHTPDGLEQVLRALRDTCKGRLIALFGCGGDRDRLKRPLMCRAACRYADIVIVTSDNPRTEDPEKIIEDILTGADGSRKLLVEPDRRRAIALALKKAKAGDTVLLAGKGHEKYQIIGREKLPFDEREEVRKILADFRIKQGDEKT